MDFDIKKPTHIFAILCLLFGTFAITILFPILSFFIQPYESINYLETISGFARFFFEIFALLLQLTIVILAFIIVPFLWYTLVNKLSLKEIQIKILLHFKRIDMVLIWAFLAVVAGFVVIFIAGIIMTVSGFNLQDFSNIPDLELIFTLPSIIIVIIIQPICEEIFYRGFLLDKISSLSSEKIAIVITGILFGIAHLMYQNLYPAILTAILGIIFAYIVLKTKSLLTAIIAHITYNVISITLYIFARSFLFQSVIL
jgi:membrane protease YdiL (CAAX protease family)